VNKNAEFWSNREFVLSLVERNGLALQYAYEVLRSDREFVLEAVKLGRGAALDYVSNALKTDQEIAAVCCELRHRSGNAFSLQFETGMVQKMTCHFRCLQEMAFHKKIVNGHKECMLALVQKWGYALEYANDNLRGDKEVVLAAVSNAGSACLKYTTKQLQGDVDVVEASRQNTAS